MTSRAEPSRKAMLAALRELAHKLGRTPKTDELIKAAKRGHCPWPGTYHTHFGSYRRALRAAGLEPVPLGTQTKYDPPRLLRDLRRLAKQLGHSPSIAEIYEGSRQRECAAYNTYRAHFASHAQMLEAAGLPPATRPLHRPKPAIVKRMLGALRKLAAASGRTPTAYMIMRAHKDGECSYRPAEYRRAFGSVNAAYAEAGLPAPQPGDGPPRYTDQQLLDALRRLAVTLGHTPSATEWIEAAQNKECPSIRSYQNHFGGLKAARAAAGLGPIDHKGAYTEQELLDGLRRLAKKLGHTPLEPEINQANKRGLCPSATVYRHRFGGLRQARAAAGLGPAVNKRRRK